MKKRIVFILVFLFAAVAAHAQTQTNVTATITDPLGIPYANGTYSVQLIPTGNNPSVNGAGIGGAFNGRMDAMGSFNISLWPNASITPGGTKWQFTICVSPGVAPPLGTGGQCTPPTSVTISGATQSLSATLSAVAPALTTVSVGGTIGGTIAANQIAFGSAANTITGSSVLTYLAASNLFSLASTATRAAPMFNVSNNGGAYTCQAVFCFQGHGGATLSWSGATGLLELHTFDAAPEALIVTSGANTLPAHFEMSFDNLDDTTFETEDHNSLAYGIVEGPAATVATGAGISVQAPNSGDEIELYSPSLVVDCTITGGCVGGNNTAKITFTPATPSMAFFGTTSGSAGIGVPAAAGSPCTILLPITSPTLNQVLTSAAPSGGNCQTSWAASAACGTCVVNNGTNTGTSAMTLSMVEPSTISSTTQIFQLGPSQASYDATVMQSAFNDSPNVSGILNQANQIVGFRALNQNNTAGQAILGVGARTYGNASSGTTAIQTSVEGDSWCGESTVTFCIGADFQFHDTASTANATNGIGVLIYSPTIPNGATVAAGYGLYIQNQAITGVTFPYAIKTGNGFVDFSASSNTFVSSRAGATAGTDGEVAYDTTNKNTHVRTNGADSIAATETAAIAANAIPKATSSTLGLLSASSLSDNGTTASTSDAGGFTSRSFNASGSTAGFVDYVQGTTSSAVSPCNASNTICEQAPTAVTSYVVTKPGTGATGALQGNISGGVITQSFSGDSNHAAVQTIGSGTSIGSTQLCTSGNCPAGTYVVNTYVDITTACGTSGTYVVNLIYTDDTGASKTIPINIQGTGSVPATGVLTTTSTTNFGEATQVIRSNGAASINFSTTAVACGTGGPMVGKLYLSVAAVQ